MLLPMTVQMLCDSANRTLQLWQCQYIVDILEHFGMADSNPVPTPMDPSLTLTAAICLQAAEEHTVMASMPCLSAVSSLRGQQGQWQVE